MVRAVHYMSSSEARWRAGKWLVVCTSGEDGRSRRTVHDRRLVTCKRCRTILAAIDAYRASTSVEIA